MNLPLPKIEPIPGSDTLFRLLEDYVVEHKGRRFTVKKGFWTDGESIPRTAWIFTGHPLQGRGLPAAIIHDVLYGSELLKREEADLIFKELLERNGVNWFRAMLRYRALRFWGGLTWTTHTPKTREMARKFIEIEMIK